MLGVSSNLVTSFFFKEKEKQKTKIPFVRLIKEFDHFVSPSFSSYVLRCQATAGAVAGARQTSRGESLVG
jgi:hypothetical protein